MHADSLRDPHNPQAQSLRALPKPSGLATESGLSWGHISLCSVLITPPLTVPVTSSILPSSKPLPRKGGKGRSTGLPGFPLTIWASPSTGTDKHVPMDRGDYKAHLQGSLGQVVRRKGNSIGARSLSPHL